MIPVKLDLGPIKLLAEIDPAYLPACPDPATNETADPLFANDQETIQMVQFNVDSDGPYDDGAGTNPRIQIYKNGMNAKVAAKGYPTHVPCDITQNNTIGVGMTAGGTVVKVFENGEDKTDEWFTEEINGSKDFTGVIPNIKFVYQNQQ